MRRHVFPVPQVVGTVFRVDQKGAYVDVGGKSTAYCPTAELSMAAISRVRPARCGDIAVSDLLPWAWPPANARLPQRPTSTVFLPGPWMEHKLWCCHAEPTTLPAALAPAQSLCTLPCPPAANRGGWHRQRARVRRGAGGEQRRAHAIAQAPATSGEACALAQPCAVVVTGAGDLKAVVGGFLSHHFVAAAHLSVPNIERQKPWQGAQCWGVGLLPTGGTVARRDGSAGGRQAGRRAGRGQLPTR